MRKYLSIPAITVLFAIFACGSSETPADKIKDSSVTLLTHDSFAVSECLFDTFTSETGIAVEQLSLGDMSLLSGIVTSKWATLQSHQKEKFLTDQKNMSK